MYFNVCYKQCNNIAQLSTTTTLNFQMKQNITTPTKSVRKRQWCFHKSCIKVRPTLICASLHSLSLCFIIKRQFLGLFQASNHQHDSRLGIWRLLTKEE